MTQEAYDATSSQSFALLHIKPRLLASADLHSIHPSWGKFGDGSALGASLAGKGLLGGDSHWL